MSPKPSKLTAPAHVERRTTHCGNTAILKCMNCGESEILKDMYSQMEKSIETIKVFYELHNDCTED